MSKFVGGLLSLALLSVASVYADDKKDEKKDEKKPQTGRRQPGERPNVSSLLQQFQRPGGGQLLSEKDMEALKLDDKQKEKVAAIVKDFESKQKESQEATRKAFEDLRGGGGDPTKIREAMQKVRDAGTKVREDAESKLTAVLNEDQKKKFEELKKARGTRGGFGGFQPGAGGFGRGGAFTPGQILPPGSKDRLELNDDQKKKLDDLEKKVKDELNKILTEDQKKKLEQGGGTRRPGGQPGQTRPGQARPRPDQN